MDTALEIKIKARQEAWELAKTKKDVCVGYRLTGEPFKEHDVFGISFGLC